MTDPNRPALANAHGDKLRVGFAVTIMGLGLAVVGVMFMCDTSRLVQGVCSKPDVVKTPPSKLTTTRRVLCPPCDSDPEQWLPQPSLAPSTLSKLTHHACPRQNTWVFTHSPPLNIVVGFEIAHPPHPTHSTHAISCLTICRENMALSYCVGSMRVIFFSLSFHVEWLLFEAEEEP